MDTQYIYIYIYISVTCANFTARVAGWNLSEFPLKFKNLKNFYIYISLPLPCFCTACSEMLVFNEHDLKLLFWIEALKSRLRDDISFLKVITILIYDILNHVYAGGGATNFTTKILKIWTKFKACGELRLSPMVFKTSYAFPKSLPLLLYTVFPEKIGLNINLFGL